MCTCTERTEKRRPTRNPYMRTHQFTKISTLELQLIKIVYEIVNLIHIVSIVDLHILKYAIQYTKYAFIHAFRVA